MAVIGRFDGLHGPSSIVRRREGGLLDWMSIMRALKHERKHPVERQDRLTGEA